jgi:hypothetical protein
MSLRLSQFTGCPSLESQKVFLRVSINYIIDSIGLGKERKMEWPWSPRGNLQFQNAKEDGGSKIFSCSQNILLQKMIGHFYNDRVKVLKGKYLTPNSIEDWGRTPRKKM